MTSDATILLIDSDADSIAIYSTMLQHHGYHVIPARDGMAGVRMAVETRPSVIVADLFPPRIAGETIADQLREDPRTATIPLIVLNSFLPFGAELLPVGGSATFLPKPCEPSKLLQEVQRLLSAAVSPAT